MEDDKIIVPHICLPDNFPELVPRFYQLGGKERIDSYADKLKLIFQGHVFDNKNEVLLQWDKIRGLTAITESSSLGGSLFLNGSRCPAEFVPHNMNNIASFTLAPIALEYI